MYYTYVLYSEKFNQIYVGHSKNLNKRVKEHNLGLSSSTKRYIPWELAYDEKFSTRSEAMKREKELKSSRGRNFIWNEIIKKKYNVFIPR